MSSTTRLLAITALNVRSIPRHAGSAVVTVAGVAVAIAVLISVMAIAKGMMTSATATGRPENVVVLRGGATSEFNSSITLEQALVLTNAPGIRRSPDGKPLLYRQLASTAVLASGERPATNVILRGVDDSFFAVNGSVRVVEGSPVDPRRREVIVGRQLARQHVGMAVGRELELQGVRWQIVGIFESAGDWHEFEVITSQGALKDVIRGADIQSVVAALTAPDAMKTFVDWVGRQPNLPVQVLGERDYYRRASEKLTTVLYMVAYVIGGIMSAGVLFSVVNSLYASVDSRRIEIATLRALGFTGRVLLCAMLVESGLLTLLGSGIGCALAWALFDGKTVDSIGSMDTFARISFPLRVDLGTVAIGLTWGWALGLVGAISPAMKATRMRVTDALKRH